MIEKAETSLGIPSPTELSAQVEEEQKEQGEAAGPVITDINEYINLMSLVYVIFMYIYICLCSTGEASSQTDEAAGEGSVAMGSAMGMLTSLTSVVQSTVSRNVRRSVHISVSDPDSFRLKCLHFNVYINNERMKIIISLQ